MGGKEGGGGADPGLIAVVIDPHHLAAAQANEGDEGGEMAAVGPYIKDTDLGLGGSGGGVNDGFEGHTFLEEVIRAAVQRYGGKVVVGGGEEDALAGEGVEGLEYPAVTVGR